METWVYEIRAYLESLYPESTPYIDPHQGGSYARLADAAVCTTDDMQGTEFICSLAAYLTDRSISEVKLRCELNQAREVLLRQR